MEPHVLVAAPPTRVAPTPQYGVSCIAEAATFTNPLEAALHAVLARVRRQAEPLGFTDLAFSLRHTQRLGQQAAVEFCFVLARPGQAFHEKAAVVEAHGATLDAAELLLSAKLADEFADATWHEHELDPCCQGNAQLASLRALASEYPGRADDAAIAHAKEEGVPSWA